MYVYSELNKECNIFEEIDGMDVAGARFRSLTLAYVK